MQQFCFQLTVMMVFAHFVPKETQVRLQERQTTGQAATYVSSGFTSPALQWHTATAI